MGNSDLISILKSLYSAMRECHRETGVCGVLEWHPTGAVVTKQVVELLAGALGGFKLVVASTLKKWRKWKEKSKERNKFADRIDQDILPEFFAFLDCLRGVQGVTIIGILRTKPPNIDSLSNVNKIKAIEQNMLEESPAGSERYSTYKAEYENLAGPVPSIKVRINYLLIPKLIKAIQSNT